ncbi:uncharacterized protein [Littorina saxatilis]|uniref:uncharacterized protein isoform X2 n=1 Tax=Littorina saxatilis TaxID=31220 RepID=UPI0038B4FFE0
MRRVLQIHGGVAILGVHLFLLLHLQLPPSIATPNELSDEESKSLWHQMADSMSVVSSEDRDRFLDLCLKRRIMCDNARFMGVKPDFQWRSGITQSSKDRFWHSYTCTYNRDIKQCPVDGLWSSWSPWSRCGATCDAKGNQTRTRTCSNPVPVRGGDRCHGSMMRSRPCLGTCTDPSKGGGVEEAEAFLKEVHEAYPDLMHDCYDAHCTYGVVKRVIFEPHVRAKYWSSLSCVKYGGACPVDGKWGNWSEWSQCSLKCGTGSRTRTRTCDQPPPNFGGHPCTGAFHEEQSCIMKDCGATTTETFTEWTKWSSCSISCGGYGIQTATMVCLRHAGCDLMGVLTPYVNRSRPCYPGDCPNQGGWSEWTDWTECSAACGAGRQSRLRLCDSPFPTGGLYCLGDPLDFRLCKGDSCAGQPSPPEKTAYRRKPGEEDEEVLIGKSDEYLNGPLNPNMESTYNPWTPWSPCSDSCGTGSRKRTRWCSVSSTPLPPCEGEVQQVQFCNVFVCPVVGGWGVWMPWTPCAVTCGKGKRQRYRQCNNPLPEYGGSCDGDGMRVETCEMGNCPRVAGGSWSKWTQWSVCTVTCGGGERARQRSRQRSNGQSNGFSSFGQPGSLQQDQQEAGSKERLTCNAQPCPVDGSWAEWAEWSRCSSLCGLGRRTRDRTCTDPAPIFAGTACLGPGTDLAHCFAGPCKDAEDRALRMGPTSWIRYAPRNRPSRFLMLYLHFKPMEPSGSLLRRYRQCRSVFDDEDEDKDDSVDDEDKANDNADRKADADEKCEFMVNLKLEQAEVILSAQVRGATLEIRSPVTLSLGAWHELLVEVMKSGASLRVNNHERLYANFSRTLVKDLDFDSYMSIGAMDNDTAGMVGSISTVSVNFRTQDLFAATDWEGQGTPVSRHAVSLQSINPSIQLPHFRGIYYSPIRMYHTERLTVRVTLALDRGEGLLLYARGQSEDTLFSLGIKKTRPIICVVCSPTIGNVCHQGDLLRLHQWYHFSLHVEDNEAELRVDQGKALQLTCKGLPYRPRKVLYVGGRSALVWDDVQRATNYTEGFFGVLGTVVVNGRTVPFRQAVLMGRDDRINPDGYSRATRITPVFEHKTSIVTLHCEIAKPVDPLTEVKVIWLRSDAVLEPSDFVEIIKPVGIEKLVGTLQLQPGGHTEGIYSCVISRDGILELAHVFPVFRYIRE